MINEKGNNLKIEKRLYKADINSNSWRDFQSKCNCQRPTIILCEVKFEKRFGAFTSICWDLSDITNNDERTFIFSFDNKQKYSKNNCVNCRKNCGPYFSGGSLGLIYDNPDGEFIDHEHLSCYNKAHANIPTNELTGADRFI